MVERPEFNELFATSLLVELFANPSYRDPLLKIGQLSPEFTMMRALDDQDSLKRSIEIATTPLIDALTSSFI